MNPWWQNRFDCIQKQCCFLFLGHIFYIQLQELQPSTTHYPDVSRKGTKECSSQMHLSLCILSVRINFGNEKHLYLITLLLKECHSQREFQCLGARERDFFFFFLVALNGAWALCVSGFSASVSCLWALSPHAGVQQISLRAV